MSLRSRLLWSLTPALLVWGLDRLAKWWVLTFIPLWSRIPILPFLELEHVRNTGVAFGLFQGYPFLFTLIPAAITLWLLWIFPHLVRTRLTALTWGMILGGALGNLTDRILYGAVIDFLRIPYWPTFNLADAAISTAIPLFFLLAYGGKDPESDEPRPTDVSAERSS